MPSKCDERVLESLRAGKMVGVVEGITNNDYHSLDKYWSSTQIKYMADNSPLHFKAKYIDKILEPREQTESLALGSLIHCLTLDPDSFAREFLILPELNLRTKEGREIRDSILKENPGKTIIKQETLQVAHEMVASILRTSRAVDLLKGLKKELAYFWTCPYSGLPLRAKADAIGASLVELKTVMSARKDDFEKQVDNLNYDLALWHYVTGAKIQPEFGALEGGVWFIAIEKEPPYVCEVYEAHESVLEVGQAKWLDAIDKISDGVFKNYWPGFVSVRAVDSGLLMPTPWGAKKWLKSEITKELSGGV